MINEYVDILKKLIARGEISGTSPIIEEVKNILIDKMSEKYGHQYSSEIGALIDKIFDTEFE